MKATLHVIITSMLLTLGTSCAKVQEQPVSEPLRLLNHWDNLDGTVERGYAGHSIFWNHGGIDSACINEYGQRNQAIGINGTVINNVNASPKMLTQAYLDTTAVYADLLRPYGIKVYLAVNFATPKALGETGTADPLDESVIEWWGKKATEIYTRIPDFGGFLVKANSEGQPGPCDYARTHAEGANMLAKALKKGAQNRGIANIMPYVIWRSFVYSPSDPDRAKQAYIEFATLDGQFDENVIIQIKNGPIDFQPREPVSPLFFAMPHTRLMAELQITQEYLGHSNHTAFLAPMWTEFLSEAQAEGLKIRDFAGVSNIGYNAVAGQLNHGRAWCGNKLAEANWFAFGRLASDPDLSAEEIVHEWVSNEFKDASEIARNDVEKLLLMSREAVVNYMMPLGLHHIFAWGHHYGPEPWCAIPGARPDWMPSYYHRADAEGLGFDRTESTGSGATRQYAPTFAAQYEDIDLIPEKYLLWFHHTPWNYTRRWECCGEEETLWQHLGRHYAQGVDDAKAMLSIWENMKREGISEEMYNDMLARLCCQVKDAVWWHDACLLYFQQFSQLPWPATAHEPQHKFDDLAKVKLRITNYECPSLKLLDSVR